MTSTAFYVYLVDEITMLPVLDPSKAIYPIELKVTDSKFKKIVPLAQNTLCAIKVANNIAGLASMFGYNVQMDAAGLNDAQAFLKDVGDDDEVSTISKLYNIDPRYSLTYSLTHSFIHS